MKKAEKKRKNRLEFLAPPHEKPHLRIPSIKRKLTPPGWGLRDIFFICTWIWVGQRNKYKQKVRSAVHCTDTPAETFYVPPHCHVTYFTHNPEIMKQNNDARRSSQPTSPLREIIISRPRKSPLAGPPRFLHTTMFCYFPPHAPPHERPHLRIPSIRGSWHPITQKKGKVQRVVK